MSLPAITNSHLFDLEAQHAAHVPEFRTLNPESSARGQELQEAFTDFVGQTFFGQLIAQMRKTVDKPAYFHGGRAEEVFQGQLDQLLAENLADASSEQFAEPMFNLYSIQRAA